MKDNLLVLEDITILWPNFRGERSQYNQAGDRSFHIAFDADDPTVPDLIAEGWNVRERETRDGHPFYALEVAVKFENWPPSILQIGEITGNKTRLTADTVELLDTADYGRVDVELSPYRWDVNGRQGTKAYLRTMYVFVKESPLEIKYAEALVDWEPGTPIFGD